MAPVERAIIRGQSVSRRPVRRSRRGTTPERYVGGFIDVYLDFDQSGTDSAGDGKINDTFLISSTADTPHPGRTGGLPAIPAILDGSDPAGADHGVGFADFTDRRRSIRP